MTSPEILQTFVDLRAGIEAVGASLPKSENNFPFEVPIRFKQVYICDDGVVVKVDTVLETYKRLLLAEAARDKYNLSMFIVPELYPDRVTHDMMLTTEPKLDDYTELKTVDKIIEEQYPDEYERFQEFKEVYGIIGIHVNNLGVDPNTNKVKIFDWIANIAVVFEPDKAPYIVGRTGRKEAANADTD